MSGYTICDPGSVTGWTPRSNFLTFIVKANAGEKFVEVNNCVQRVCEDIDLVVSALNTLKKKMGDNTGTTSQIERVVKALQEKRQDVVTKNKELISAINQVVDYIYHNKSTKSKEADSVASTVERISIYQG